MTTVDIGSVIDEGRHALQPSTEMASTVRDHVFNNYTPMLKALASLLCCPVFNGEIFKKDPYSHRVWTVAREAFHDAANVEVEDQEEEDI